MEEYKELIDSFCELNKKKKQAEIRDELQELLMVFHKLCKDKRIDDKILLHKEMRKLEEEKISEEEFLNATYAYIISIKSIIGKYFS